MPNRILLIFITLLFGIGSASAQKYPERSLVRKATGISRRSGTTAASNDTRRRSKRPPKTSRPPTTWEAPFTAPKIRRGGQDARTHRRRLHPHRPGTGRGFLQPGQRPIQAGKYPEALESYKNSLRMNPADQEAKYNYAYTKRLLQNSRTRIKTKIRTRTSRTAAVRIRIKTKQG